MASDYFHGLLEAGRKIQENGNQRRRIGIPPTRPAWLDFLTRLQH